MKRNSTLAHEADAKRMDLLVSGVGKLNIQLTPERKEWFYRYYVELFEWNKRVNLTSITAWEDVQRRHFLDSLTVSLVIPVEYLDSAKLLDVASGGGFPGVPLKIAFPGLSVTLLDATAKKTAFLSHLVDELELSDVNVLTGRAETLAHDGELREHFDVVTARAVANLSTLAELTLPFCKTGGIVVAQKGMEIADELDNAMRAIEKLGGALTQVKEVDEEVLGYPSNLVVIEKVALTPERYPRRPGMPSKRPL